jgi:hypothetical protein
MTLRPQRYNAIRLAGNVFGTRCEDGAAGRHAGVPLALPEAPAPAVYGLRECGTAFTPPGRWTGYLLGKTPAGLPIYGAYCCSVPPYCCGQTDHEWVYAVVSWPGYGTLTACLRKTHTIPTTWTEIREPKAVWAGEVNEDAPAPASCTLDCEPLGLSMVLSCVQEIDLHFLYLALIRTQDFSLLYPGGCGPYDLAPAGGYAQGVEANYLSGIALYMVDEAADCANLPALPFPSWPCATPSYPPDPYPTAQLFFGDSSCTPQEPPCRLQGTLAGRVKYWVQEAGGGTVYYAGLTGLPLTLTPTTQVQIQGLNHGPGWVGDWPGDTFLPPCRFGVLEHYGGKRLHRYGGYRMVTDAPVIYPVHPHRYAFDDWVRTQCPPRLTFHLLSRDPLDGVDEAGRYVSLALQVRNSTDTDPTIEHWMCPGVRLPERLNVHWTHPGNGYAVDFTADWVELMDHTLVAPGGNVGAVTLEPLAYQRPASTVFTPGGTAPGLYARGWYGERPNTGGDYNIIRRVALLPFYDLAARQWRLWAYDHQDAYNDWNNSGLILSFTCDPFYARWDKGGGYETVFYE